jgi:hypothetical protein
MRSVEGSRTKGPGAPTRPWRLGVPRGGKWRGPVRTGRCPPQRPRLEARERPRGGRRMSPRSPLDTGYGLIGTPYEFLTPHLGGAPLRPGRKRIARSLSPAGGPREGGGGREGAVPERAEGLNPPSLGDRLPEPLPRIRPLVPRPRAGEIGPLREASHRSSAPSTP